MKRIEIETERLAIYGLVLLSLILSIISLCNSHPCTNGLDYIGVIVGILSLLVTILIGWQLVNYFVVEKRMRGYAKKLIEKYRHSVNCYVIALYAVQAYQSNNTEMGIDTSMNAIDEGLKGYDKDSISLPISQLTELAKRYKAGTYSVRIYKEKRNEYLKTILNTEDTNVGIIVDMIQNADEV
jgi:hypothetical protein